MFAPPSGFIPAHSPTGSLELAWPPFAAAELHAWVLLCDPGALTPAALHPEALLRELIRVPLDPERGAATVYVPVDRPLGVLLMARDADGRPLPSPAPTVRPGPPVARSASPPEPPRADGPPKAPPAATTPAAAGRALPLVFARGKEPLPDLSAMARRIAERVGAAVGPATTEPANAASATDPATDAAQASGDASPRQGFGARQRWTLTRLGFAPAGPHRERALVVRATFLSPAELRSWERALPDDAVPLPPQCDGLVDARTPDDAMAFYAVLEGPAPWHPLPLQLLNPPFDESRRPFVLGDAARRLAPLAAATPTSEAHASLVAAALRGLVEPCR